MPVNVKEAFTKKRTDELILKGKGKAFAKGMCFKELEERAGLPLEEQKHT